VAIVKQKVVAHHKEIEILFKEIDKKFGPAFPLFVAKVEIKPFFICLPSLKASC